MTDVTRSDLICMIAPDRRLQLIGADLAGLDSVRPDAGRGAGSVLCHLAGGRSERPSPAPACGRSRRPPRGSGRERFRGKASGWPIWRAR